MKTSLLVGAALAFLGLAAAPLSAQTQTTTSTTSSSGYVQTSKIIGTKVKSSSGEEIGVVKDVVIDRSTGCMAYTVVSAGGTGTRITGQAKTVAVPWAVYSTTSTDTSVLAVTVDRDRIYNAPVFDYARITEYTTPTFIGNVYSYYGVSAGGVSGAAYGTTTTGATSTTATGTSTTATGAAGAGASATPMATPMATAAGAYGASPAATASPATSASPAASGAAREEGERGRGRARMSPAGSPAEEATGRAKTGASPETGTSPAESPRTRGEGVREKSEASPAETGESPSGERKKARRHRGEESPATGASPSTPEEQE